MKHPSSIAAGLFVWLLFLLCSLSISHAQSHAFGSAALEKMYADSVLRVGVNPLFKPFSFEKDGKRVGVDIDIAELLAKKLGVALDIVIPDSFSDLIPMLEAGKIDIIIAGMSITFDRAKKVDFTQPYFDTGMSILLNKIKVARLGVKEISTYHALTTELAALGKESQLVIAVTEGKAAQRIVPQYFEQATVKAYPTNELAAEATLKGEADIMVHDEIFLKVWLQEHAKEAQFRLVVLDPPFKPDFYGMAIARGNQQFLNMLDVFTLELRANNSVEKFLGHYLPEKATTHTRSYNLSEDIYGGD